MAGALSPLIAILRGVTPDEVVAMAGALERAGIAIVEVRLNSPQPIESIALLRREFGQRLVIGAGTVMATDQEAAIAEAGGRPIVTPHVDTAMVAAAKTHGLLAMPGFFKRPRRSPCFAPVPTRSSCFPPKRPVRQCCAHSALCCPRGPEYCR